MNFPVYVLHVKKGYEEREANIEKMLSGQNMQFEYVLDGDIPDITDEILDRYFAGSMHVVGAEASCSLKHILACQRLVDSDREGALILEDDIVLYRHFPRRLQALLDECRDRGITDFLLSLEESNLMYVPRSRRHPGVHVYKADRDRFAGCYYITRGAAKILLDRLGRRPMDIPIDVFHSRLIAEIGFPYYWAHPALATQGSHNGYFSSSISDKRASSRLRLRMAWHIKRLYKQMLYNLR